MTRLRNLFISGCLGLLAFGSEGALAQDVDAVITVVGEGRVAVVPNMATISVGVTFDGKTAAEALDQTSFTTGEVLTLLSEIGIEQADMQTNNLRLSPLYNDRSSSGVGRSVQGYRAENTVQIRVRSLGDLGVILDDVVASGANQFFGLSFGVQDPSGAMDSARQAAVADALRKATLYAAAAGVDLGPIVSITETSDGSNGPGAFEMRATSVPVAAGNLDITAAVTVVFSLSDG